MPEAPYWLISLPETEQECEMRNSELLDVAFGDVPAEEMSACRQKGIVIGHA